MFGTRGGVGHNFCHSFDGLYLKESLQEFLNPLSIIPPWLKFLSGIPAAIPSGTAHQKNERSCGLPPPLVPNILFFCCFQKVIRRPDFCRMILLLVFLDSFVHHFVLERIHWGIFLDNFVRSFFGDGVFCDTFLSAWFLDSFVHHFVLERIHWCISLGNFVQFFSAMVFFVTLFYRPDSCRMILLLVFWTVLFTILFRKNAFTADHVFLLAQHFWSVFSNFWIFDFCEIHVICPNLWGATPPFSFIHKGRFLGGYPPP